MLPRHLGSRGARGQRRSLDPQRLGAAAHRVPQAEVTGVDLATCHVRAEPHLSLRCDVLVLAAGATHAYFGHDAWVPLAPGLKTIEDVTELRRRIPLAFERAEEASGEAERRELLIFVVVGGGPIGAETAGAIAELARTTLGREFRRTDPAEARIRMTLPRWPPRSVRRRVSDDAARRPPADLPIVSAGVPSGAFHRITRAGISRPVCRSIRTDSTAGPTRPAQRRSTPRDDLHSSGESCGC